MHLATNSFFTVFCLPEVSKHLDVNSLILTLYFYLPLSLSGSLFLLTVPSSPSFFTKVLNKTAMQVFWELPSKPGKVEGFKLAYREVPQPDFQGQEVFPGHINTHTISHLGLSQQLFCMLFIFFRNQSIESKSL